MSSRDLSRVVALSCKAFSLHVKGYYARALEENASATAAAQELAQEDCLVVTQMQIIRLGTLSGYKNIPGVGAEAASAAIEQQSELLHAAVATLERRRAAGTLLPGMCRSWPEEEWYGQWLQHRQVVNKEPAYTPTQLALLVQLVGRDAYLHAVSEVVLALSDDPHLASSELLALGRFAVHAIDLFEQPRLKLWDDDPLPSENVLTASMEHILEVLGPVVEAHDPPVPWQVLEVLTRWQRFARSGALRERGFDAGVAYHESVVSAYIAANDARLAAATLRCCSLSSCGARELHPKHFKQCGACKTVVYCCREHQLEDWPAHKAACKAARKAAAQEAGGAA